MNIAAVVRKGFSACNLDDLSWSKYVLHYELREPFSLIWERVLQTGAEYALLVDDIIPCDGRHIWLLHQILKVSPNIHGITLDADGLESVYCVTPPIEVNRRLSWRVDQLKTLPSWLAFLRVNAWKKTDLRTPEFFLLQQSIGQRVLRTVMPRLDFDPLTWAADLVASAAPMLAADYATVGRDGSRIEVPPQLKVAVSGTKPVPSSLKKAISHPIFSVICPSIRPDFLGEAVTSVTNQRFAGWELWIGIDGPKEIQRRRIEHTLAAFQSDHRVHIRYYKHTGTGPLRRLLSEHAKGEYIVALDDDDRLAPTALERFSQAIHANPGIPIVRGGTRIFGLIEAYLPPRPRYLISGIPNDLFEVHQPYAVRRDMLASLGGFEWDPDMKDAGEDSDLLLKADREGFPVHLIDEPLYERRLSTLNQTLDCTAEECRRHIHNLYRKHNPVSWTLDEVRLSANGSMINMVTVHRKPSAPDTVVCSTQFMNFQQVGSRERVVVDLEVTSLCNAVCTFCPRSFLQRDARFIDIDNVKRLSSFIRREANIPTVVICGIGEPTLHPQLLELVSILGESGANVCMTTNGWNLTTVFLDSLFAAGLSELNVSMNAATRETHEYLMRLKNFDEIYAVCREIANVRAHRWPSLKFHVSFVLTKKNQVEVGEFVDQWRGSGVSRIWIHPLTNRAGLITPDCDAMSVMKLAQDLSGESEVTVDLFPSIDGPSNLCHVAGGIDFISVDGEMLLCAQDYGAQYRFGNIANEELARLHENKVLRHLRGETVGTCFKCTFCPLSFRKGQDQAYSIVQAGAY